MGKPGRQVLWSGEQRGETQGLRSAGKLRGGLPGSGRGSRVVKGHQHPGVEKFPWGDETSGVTPKGDRVLGEDRQGMGGERNPPTIRYTNAVEDSNRDEEMTSGLGLAAPPSPQRGTAAGRGSKVQPYRHPDGASPKSAIE